MSYEVTSNGFSLLSEGEYECNILKAEIKTTPNGKEYIHLELRIRDDIEQEGKNRVLFDSIWHDQERPELFNRKRINGILGSCGYKEGVVFEGINDVLDAIVGKPIIAVVCVSHNDYSDKDENRVKYYKSTNNAPAVLGGTKPNEMLDAIEEADLPF